MPVDLEPARAVHDYAADRVFAVLSLAGSDLGAVGTLADELEAAGQPVIRIELDDPIDVAAECIRWEVATAIAGVVLGINAFDQPNVEEAKELTRKVLAGASRAGASGAGEAGDADDGAIVIAAHDADSLAELAPTDVAGSHAARTTWPSRRSSHRREGVDAAIARLRTALAATHCATTAGYGPRFLHSTGQLHKGGPPTGCLPPADLGPPGRSTDPRLAVHLRPAHRCAGARAIAPRSAPTIGRSSTCTSAQTW